MRAVIVVPARFASQRFPGKPLATLRGAGGEERSLVRRSWDAALAVPGIDSVHVATDDDRIAEAVRAFGGDVIRTPGTCANGTERCAAALSGLPTKPDMIVNLQGDAPLTPVHAVTALLEAMRADPTIAVATPAVAATGALRTRLIEDRRAGRVGGTTVTCDAAGDALYFSKTVIPYIADASDQDTPLLLHLGVYAYRHQALLAYPPDASPLERAEGLEQLRFLHAGVPVRVVPIALEGMDVWELNNPEDIAPIEAELARRGIA